MTTLTVHPPALSARGGIGTPLPSNARPPNSIVSGTAKVPPAPHPAPQVRL